MRLRTKNAGLRSWALVVAMSFAATSLAIVGMTGQVHAQDATADDEVKQVKLTEAQIKGFIAAQPDIAKISEKMQGSTSDKPDPAIQTELEATAKKFGFKSFAEYDDVAANITMVMAGIDPVAGTYTDPVTSIKKEIEEVKANTTMQDKDKQQTLDELNEALKNTQPLQFPENIELVKKFKSDLEKVLQ
jgi:hypothetical protein